VKPHYLIVVGRKQGLDDLEVRIEVADGVFSDIMADMLGFQQKVSDRLQTVLGLRAKITLVESGSIERSAGKSKRVLDTRDTA